MIRDPKAPKNQQRPPGDRLKKLASRNRAAETVMSQLHVLQIIDDHQLMWYSTTDPAERQKIESRLRRQLTLAGVNFVGFEVAIHGAIGVVVSDPLNGGSLIALGIALMYAAGKGA